MKKRYTLIIVILILSLTGCSFGSVYDKKQPGNSSAISKSDLQFYVQESFLEESKHVSELNDNLSFSLTYVKETKNEYCCVNMESFLIYLVIDTENITGTVKGLEDIFYEKGIRLDMDEDKSVKGYDAKSKEKLIVEDVYCEALLSQEFYEDFTGKAAIIKDTYRSIVLFVGAKGRQLELSKSQEKLLKDIVLSLTTTKTIEEQMEQRSGVAEKLTLNEEAKVSCLNENGVLDSITIQDIEVAKDEEAVVNFFYSNTDKLFYKELKRAPIGYEWQLVTVTGDNLDRLNIKVADKKGEVYETGSRTYTIRMTENTRTDAYLVLDNAEPYQLEFGEIGYKSILKINK